MSTPARTKPPTKEEKRLSMIIDRVADGIVIVDGDGIIRFVNPAAAQLFGRKPAELVGEPFGFPIEDGGGTEIELVQRGGGTVMAELRIVATDWDGTEVSIVTLRDVTDRKKAEERERQLARAHAARAEAEAANQAKSEFLAVMSHELRTPLNAVLGYAELLDLGLAGPLTAEQRQQLGRISASGRHLLGLVNEVLDLAKVESRQLVVENSSRCVADAVGAAVMLVQPQAEERGHTIDASGAIDAEHRYVGDEDRVRQILVNLLSNAVKFTDPGGKIVVSVDRCADVRSAALERNGKEWICLSVRDSGRGIAPEDQEAVFAPFVQTQRGHTRGQDGSGLGLTISRRLARLMDGDITLKSAPGTGSTFTLWLPAAEGRDALDENCDRSSLTGKTPRVTGLAELGEALLRETEPLLDSLVARLRVEELVPQAAQLKYTQIADHLSTFIAELAGALVILEESGGEPTSLMNDGSDIQRLLAERHGAQRARLGWTREAIAREYDILGEEVEKVLRRRFPAESGGRLREATSVLGRLVEQAETISTRALDRALGANSNG
jgi:signal transduction histidine kinase